MQKTKKAEELEHTQQEMFYKEFDTKEDDDHYTSEEGVEEHAGPIFGGRRSSEEGVERESHEELSNFGKEEKKSSKRKPWSMKYDGFKKKEEAEEKAEPVQKAPERPKAVMLDFNEEAGNTLKAQKMKKFEEFKRRRDSQDKLRKERIGSRNREQSPAVP